MISTYQQALEYIHSFDDPYLAALRDRGQQTWGLERIRAALALLGDPHLALPVIHIAGTKGKGSTAALIAQGLIESGLKTGLYTSPHLQDWRERIQVDRVWIGQAELTRLVEDYRQRAGSETRISAFEVSTALALWHFQRAGCEVAVVEVGLGGRLDATNVVQPLVSVITSLSLDHTQLLGGTLAEIAAEKAAIIKAGAAAVSAPQSPEALAVIERRAQEVGSPLVLVGRDWLLEPVQLAWHGSQARIGPPGALQPVRIRLPGAFQLENAAVALATLKQAQQAGLAIRDEAAVAGLAHAEWPGRLEIVSHEPLIIIDSAHNPYSIHEMAHSLELLGGCDSLVVVFGAMADKDIGGMLGVLLPRARSVICTQGVNPRAATAETLRDTAKALVEAAAARGEPWASRVEVRVAPDLAAALQRAHEVMRPGDALCITGSLALAGEARSALGLPVSSAVPRPV